MFNIFSLFFHINFSYCIDLLEINIILQRKQLSQFSSPEPSSAIYYMFNVPHLIIITLLFLQVYVKVMELP